MDRLKPLAALGGVGSVVGHYVLNGAGVFALADWVMVNIDLLLPLATTLQHRIAPNVGWLDQSLLNQVILALSVVFVLVTVMRIARRTFD
ncbi:hypothetical protein [Halorussus pelagicus]|uniref:hypothetical protein n=1 Tax=Halorussus pelagicus TaxID=2505977 RepID=UPI000FFB17CD|nr:hypothetical protein [Halorussus pelagicus]